jgi:hypothetical protein
MNGIQLTPVAASGGPEPDLITGENEPPADPVVPQVKAGMSRLIRAGFTAASNIGHGPGRSHGRDIIHEVYSPGSNG